VILAVGWVVFLLYAFPGVMTMDSFDQLNEGRRWFFSDSHPPLMAAMWGVIDRILPGPLGMLLVQSGAFLSGVYLILRRAMSPRAAAVCACLVLVFPPIAVPLAVIWKDCVMAGFLVLGIAGILDERKHVRALGLGALVIATGVRYLALAASLPLAVLLFEWRPGLHWVKRYAIALGVWIGITATSIGCNEALTDQRNHFWHSSMALADIVGVLAFVDEDLPDAELRPLLEPTEINVHEGYHRAARAQYVSYDFQQLITGPGHLWDVPWTVAMPQARRDAITHAWKTLVFGHPGAFIRYRLENYGEVLGLNKKFQGATVVRHRAQYTGTLDYMGIGRGSSRYQEVGEGWAMWCVKKTRLFRPHVYALLSLALLAVALLRDRSRDVLALLLPGVFLELTMLPLGATPDFRYSHWLVVTTCISLVMLIARGVRRGAETS
jgi:hypothetical protein